MERSAWRDGARGDGVGRLGGKRRRTVSLRSSPENVPKAVACKFGNGAIRYSACRGTGKRGQLSKPQDRLGRRCRTHHYRGVSRSAALMRSEEHTSELQSLMRISYAVFCLKKQNNITKKKTTNY